MRSSATRVTIVCSTIFVAAAVLSGFVVFRIAHHALERELDNRIGMEMNALISEYSREGEAELLRVFQNREHAAVASGMSYGLYAADGRRIAGDMPAKRPAEGWQSLVLPDRLGTVEEQRALAVDIAEGRRLVVASDNESIERVQSSLGIALGSEMLLMIVLAAGCAVGTGRYLRGRLGGMASAAEAIIAGDLGTRVPVSGRGDEFDSLAALLNAMLDRVASLLIRLEQISGDIAHDLRTPLTRLRHQFERALEEGPTEESLQDSLNQIDHLLNLFASMLRLAEIEGGQLRESFSPVDLGALVQDIGESYAPAMDDGGRFFSVHSERTPAIRGDRELLAQALINLLDNTQVHTPPGTRVYLSVHTTPTLIRLSVADNGPGVAPEHRSRITDRFARLETSRNRPGHGLGLSLVAAIAQIHGATLSFDDRKPGLVVRLDFAR